MFCHNGSFIDSKLNLNSNVVGGIACRSIYAHLEYKVLNSASSVVIVQLNSDDVVYVRTHPTDPSGGSILSGDQWRTSFSGWKII